MPTLRTDTSKGASLSFERPELLTAPTAMLSQRHSRRLPTHCLPHTTTEKIIGRSSFGAMSHSQERPSYLHWNHWEPQWVPHPHRPDASETSGIDMGNALGRRETPFQPSVKASHQVDSFSLIQWSLFSNAESSSIRRRTKVRPGRISVAAC